jgi:SpoVK/Ycf46/Vps4 family AAA+-type ATPase
MNPTRAEIFEPSQEFPDPEGQRRLASLVGLEAHRQRLEKGLRLILDPHAIEVWSDRHHRRRLAVIDQFRRRPPLFILAGDVGTGKTSLAETVGDAVARSEKIGVTLFRLSLTSRGAGLVGEMTTLIANAFSQVGDLAAKAKAKTGKARAGYILLIDEADALAQSREGTQMHHEDRAGVNTLIRGIDDFAVRQLPAAVIMCTNRLVAIDPAVRRRAADIIPFNRPTPAHRQHILEVALVDAGFSAAQIRKLVDVTGEGHNRLAFTFSDLTQRLLPNMILDAYPDQPLRFERALELAVEMAPTPAFRDETPH